MDLRFGLFIVCFCAIVGAAPLTSSDSISNATSSLGFPAQCIKNGESHAQGDEWTIKHLRYKCGPFGLYEILGCITDTGHAMARGERYAADNVVHECVGDADGTVRYAWTICGIPGTPDCNSSPFDNLGRPKTRAFVMEFPPISNMSTLMQCEKNDKTYNAGEEWASNTFRYKCGNFGLYEILGCITETGHAMDRGERYIADNLIHECSGVPGGQIHYLWSPCGVMGTMPCDSV